MDISWIPIAGVITLLVSTLVGTLVFQNRQISNGKLVPQATHERELQAALVRGNDWKTAAESSQTALQAEKEAHAVTRGQLTEALDAGSITKMFMQEYLPKRPQAPQLPSGAV